MKQKLVIVSALVHDPSLLIIDEPMVGLDALAQRQVKLLLRRLADEKKTVFLTTHTLSVAEAVCDRIAILHRGRIVASGTDARAAQGPRAGRLFPGADVRRRRSPSCAVNAREDAAAPRASTPATSTSSSATSPAARLPWLIAHGDETVDAAALDALLARRYAGEPIQYIREASEFYGRDFYVDDRVLIPRPETELLVEAAIDRAPRGARVVDIGTGSGCIALTLALERPDLRVIGVDRSLDALAVAKRQSRTAAGERRARRERPPRRRPRARTSSSAIRRTSPRRTSRRSPPRCATSSRTSR